MRFTENGPSIPDALLQARDEGRVVFFCGAGISRARAGLPDFFGLAESVIRDLGVPSDNHACKVLKKARELGKELDVTGLISADRVFSLLERDFTPADIQSTVARCLAPAADVDRSAHEILLRLARTSTGKTQIVTTNFDRLFECDAARVSVFWPPRLPHLSRYDVLDGIVYLHGRVNSEYTGAEGDGFILSGSDFGHAYLSEGWATEFFRDIVRRYVVIFVGYSADDPPVHYLLEGLGRTTNSLNHIYAFQADESPELIARWLHKRVEAIPYSPADGHQALWETLERWANRADDPHAWQQSVLNRAMAGAAQLLPHERGQVAHIVSTYEGARAFGESKPPADWLCVFDPSCRYGRAGKLDWMDPESQTVEPYSMYGLDSDSVPQRSEDASYSVRGQVPLDAWDAFALTNIDRQDLSPDNFAAVRGLRSSQIPRLPNRLACLGMWIAHVANQPAAVWWAVRQESLHPSCRQSIAWKVSQPETHIDSVLRKAWQYILEAWDASPEKTNREWYDLKRDIERERWSSAAVRRFTSLTKPYLKVGPGLASRPVPPTAGEDYRLFELARLEVECPVPPHDADIPDEWLHHVVRGIRSNIGAAVALCREVDDPHGRHISPIAEDDRPDISDYQRTHGLSGSVIRFATLFNRLLQLDLAHAQEELSAWPLDDDLAFARLRLWASGKRELATPHAFTELLLGLSDEVFWGSYHQRDLLLVLTHRWDELSNRDQRHIEARLLRGPDQWDGEEEGRYTERRAWSVLERLQWLRTHGCKFSFDVDDAMAARRSEAPKWKPEYADHAAESRETRGGFVATDTAYGPLMREPIASVLSKAIELSGRSETNSLEERDPFAGLCAGRPKRAYLALAHAARRNKYPAWAWKTFLSSSARENDESSFSATIAARLCQLPDAELSQLLYSATWWFQKVSKALSKDRPDSFDRTVQRFVDVVNSNPASASSGVLGSNRGRDLVTEAINSALGHVVMAILDDVRTNANEPLSIRACLEKIEKCLALSGDQREHAIVLASRHLGWFHQVDPLWTERHLLSILDEDVEGDRDSLWAGFFWYPQVSSPGLYGRLKEGLLKVARQASSSREGHAQSLASLILLGWISSDGDEGPRWVADDEFRDVLLHGGDEFRSHVLWQFERSLGSDKPVERADWRSKACEFFDNVWPRQRSVKTSQMSVRLCELLVSHREGFAALIDAVLPLLTKMTDGPALQIDFRSEVNEIVKAYPERFLQLLNTVLPEDVRSWPYGIIDTINKIVEADNALATDARLLDLRRKWDAR